MQYKHEIQKLTYSIREACIASSLGRTTLYGYIARGKLDAVRVGGRTLIPATSLQSFLLGEDPEAGDAQ